MICVALCQGAGLHHVDVKKYKLTSRNGVKDFDVWSFFAPIPGQRFPADRRHTRVDFGPSKFGRWSGESPRFRHFEGRSVDLFMRSLKAPPSTDPVKVLRAWLEESRTGSQKALAAKGVVIIHPVRLRGKIAWDPYEEGRR